MNFTRPSQPPQQVGRCSSDELIYNQADSATGDGPGRFVPLPFLLEVIEQVLTSMSAQTDRSQYVRQMPSIRDSQGTNHSHRSASPFWRTSSKDKPLQDTTSPDSQRKVIGASYSHADGLGLNNL